MLAPRFRISMLIESPRYRTRQGKPAWQPPCAVLLLSLIAVVLTAPLRLSAGEPVTDSITLQDAQARLTWRHDAAGWRLGEVVVVAPQPERTAGTPSGEYTLLYSADSPSTDPVALPWSGPIDSFPEPIYGHVAHMWHDATTPVALNQAGTAYHFFPQHGEQGADGAVNFFHRSEVANLGASWRFDPKYPGDLLVTMTLTARREGYFSFASPTVTTVAPENLAWAMVPGVFAGAEVSTDLVSAYGYGQGLPARPVIARERSTSTLAPLVTHKNGATVAVVAEPGVATDPWAEAKKRVKSGGWGCRIAIAAAICRPPSTTLSSVRSILIWQKAISASFISATRSLLPTGTRFSVTSPTTSTV